MDAGDLRIFEAVARLGAMNRAAAELNTVQSNVTTRIRLLEEELGTPLFDRHSRGVTPTAAGRRLLPYARRVAQLIHEARLAVRDDGTPRGPFTFGSLETTAALHLAPLLAAYAARYPAVDLALRTGTTAELVDAVLARELEGALVCGPVSHPELQEESVFSEELVAMTAPAVAALEDLLDAVELKIVVLRRGCSYRQRLEEILARRGIVGVRTLEFGTLEAIFGCVAAGLGVTLLPKALVGPVWQQGRVAVHALPLTESQVDTVLVHRRDLRASAAFRAFASALRNGEAQVHAAE